MASIAYEALRRVLSPASDARQTQIERIVEDVTLFLELSADDWDEFHLYSGGQRVTPMDFDGVEPLTALETLYPPNIGWFPDATPEALSHPLNIAFATNLIDDQRVDRRMSETVGAVGPVIGTHYFRYRPASLADVRGRVATVATRMYECLHVEVLHDRDDARCYRMFVGQAGTRPDGVRRWAPLLLDHRPVPSALLREQTELTNLAIMHAFTRRYYWYVKLGYVGSPGVRFITDPVGVRETFRLRDIPEGRSRRAALRHWVSEHWRALRTDADTEGLVRAYLRGETDFVWNGLRCTVEPSEYDLDKNEELRAKRAALKRAGQDRRPAARPLDDLRARYGIPLEDARQGVR